MLLIFIKFLKICWVFWTKYFRWIFEIFNFCLGGWKRDQENNFINLLHLRWSETLYNCILCYRNKRICFGKAFWISVWLTWRVFWNLCFQILIISRNLMFVLLFLKLNQVKAAEEAKKKMSDSDDEDLATHLSHIYLLANLLHYLRLKVLIFFLDLFGKIRRRSLFDRWNQRKIPGLFKTAEFKGSLSHCIEAIRLCKTDSWKAAHNPDQQRTI